MEAEEKKPLRMVSCGKCGKTAFIPGNLAPLEATQCKKCGHEIIMPLMMRQFELRSPIASGGMGTVYRAWDTMLHREVAVKLMRQELTGDAKMVEAFAREARTCAGLNHTNIIHIYTFDEHEGQFYLAMELADNGSLDDRISNDGRVQELQVLDVGIKVASALDTAWKHKLLHLDIKPGNILFNADNEPKLVDFGLARSVETEAESSEGGVMGTPYYIAPERITQEREDFLSDMYSLAATLYHALTGQVPFDAETNEEVAAAHVHVPLTPPIEVFPEMTQQTSDALVCALAKNPAERYQSYDELIMALTAARSHLLVQKFLT